MKKVVRTDFNSTTLRRGVRDLNVQLYSHDKNNAGFEFVIKNEVDLSQYKARALFDFRETDITWETTGTIEGNVVKIKFDTDLISKCEEVIGYLFLDSETDSLDIFKFKFTVILSEIDKQEVGKRGFRYIKDEKVVDVITRSELEEELKKLQVNSGIDLNNYLTKEKAEEIYATKNEIPNVTSFATTSDIAEAKKSVVEEIKQLGYAKTTEIPAAYNDSALTERVTNLENKVDKDTVYDDTDLKNRVVALESKPDIDTSNFDLKTEIPQPYNDSGLASRVQALENKPTTTITSYDDSEVNRRLTELEARPTVTAYNDKPLSDRVSALENKPDNNTIYDDTALSNRVRALEDAPKVNVENFATKDDVVAFNRELNNKVSNTDFEAFKTTIPTPYNDSDLVKRVSTLETKQDKDTVYNDEPINERLTALESKPFDTYLTKTKADEFYVKKTDLPEPYNDKALSDRVLTLENKQDNDTVYNDTEVKERLTVLESKPTVDTSKFITEETLTAKKIVTKDELNTLKPNQTLSLNNGTLSISGGNSVALPASQYEIHGTGMPNGVVEAEIGTTYVDKNKTNGAFKWIKTTNGGNQGWEVLSGDTGWRTLNSVSKLGNSYVKVRRVNNEVTYLFGGLSWGWFGIVRRGGAGYVMQTTDTERNCFIVGEHGIPAGFRAPNSLIGSIYNDRGTAYGTWYVGNGGDANHLRFQFLNPVPTDSDIGDIRVSQISYLTDDQWPQQLP